MENVGLKENKVSKAQKRRDKKTEKEKERLEDIARYLRNITPNSVFTCNFLNFTPTWEISSYSSVYTEDVKN